LEEDMPSLPDLPEGFKYLPGYFSPNEQEELLSILRALIAKAPLFTPVMPRSGKPFSVKMTNFGSHGWLADKAGYRYEPKHPVTHEPWPDIPQLLLNLWDDVSEYSFPPEACLCNVYSTSAKLGMHQDKDEETFEAPIISVSLGDTAVFRVGGTRRKDPTQTFKLHSGDVVVLGQQARMCYHGIDKIIAGSSALLPEGGRINLTFRRVTAPHNVSGT